MPSPTPLDVATQAVQRLVKEETSYHKELSGQQARVAKTESEIAAGTGDENAKYVLEQEVCSFPFSLLTPSPFLLVQTIFPRSFSSSKSFPLHGDSTESCA